MGFEKYLTVSKDTKMISSTISGSTELLKTLKDSLQQSYDLREAENISIVLIEYFFEMSKTQILMDAPFSELDKELVDNLNECVKRLLEHEPIQQILGETEFYDLPFYVNEHTLIPRPETEELVHWILEDNKENSEFRLIDIGTGSGCIPISIKKNKPKADIIGLELSHDTLDVAKDNADLNEVDVYWIQDNILNYSYKADRPYDIIVSNPPYITDTEKQLMQKNVLDFEPHLALFVDDKEPLIFYDHIADYAIKHLKTNGSLYFEINEAFGKETIHLLEEKGFYEIELKKDLNDKDRMVKAIKK